MSSDQTPEPFEPFEAMLNWFDREAGHSPETLAEAGMAEHDAAFAARRAAGLPGGLSALVGGVPCSRCRVRAAQVCDECRRAVALLSFAGVARHPESGTGCLVCENGPPQWCGACFVAAVAEYRAELRGAGTTSGPAGISDDATGVPALRAGDAG
jgi:hypothetical protein